MQLEPIRIQKNHQNPTLKLPQPLLGPDLFHQVTKILHLELAIPDLELITSVTRISNGNEEVQALEEQEEEVNNLKEEEEEEEIDQVLTTNNIQIYQIPHLFDFQNFNQTKKT